MDQQSCNTNGILMVVNWPALEQARIISYPLITSALLKVAPTHAPQKMEPVPLGLTLLSSCLPELKNWFASIKKWWPHPTALPGFLVPSRNRPSRSNGSFVESSSAKRPSICYLITEREQLFKFH